MNTATNPESEPGFHPSRVIIPAGLFTLTADILFWKSSPGVSVGIFFLFIAALLITFRRGQTLSKLTLVIAGAILAACIQSAVEISFSNGIVLIALTLLLAGECYQPHLQSLWGKWSEAIYRMAIAPISWLILAWKSLESAFAARSEIAPSLPQAGRIGRKIFQIVRVVAPTIVVTGIFIAVFSAGNAVFGELLRRSSETAIDWICGFDLSFGRFVFWGLISTVALGLFHSYAAPHNPRWWTSIFPRVPRGNIQVAFQQTASLLIALNVLFCVINTLDAAYLWKNYLWKTNALPEGVSHSEFVHAGVWSLITAVVLSAVVIAGLFQQKDDVVNHRWLKNIAHLWVVQNAILIAGVFLRLKLYVMEYQWTEKRVYVGCFLILVAAGFILLCCFVEQRRSLNWLLGRCVVATFGLFFTLQFLNVSGYIARANVAQWKHHPERGLDVEYLSTLGPGAWPSLLEAAESHDDSEPRRLAREFARNMAERESSWQQLTDWRSWQYRRSAAAQWFVPRSMKFSENVQTKSSNLLLSHNSHFQENL